VDSQNSTTWNAENVHAQHENLLHSVNIGVWCAVSRKQIVGSLLFEETVTAENYPNILTQFIAVLGNNERDCRFQQAGTTANTAKQHLFCRTSSTIALSALALGHHDSQTILHLTAFCGDFFKQSQQQLIPGAWRKRKHNI
jgi:hypothetical protein